MEDSNILSDSCSVCGDKASKWRYSQYGATSCFSCRTFYRRSVENKIFKKYKCRSKAGKSGVCQITLSTRRRCAFCRYKKCRNVGMKYGQPHWVRENSKEFEIDEEEILKEDKISMEDERHDVQNNCLFPSEEDIDLNQEESVQSSSAFFDHPKFFLNDYELNQLEIDGEFVFHRDQDENIHLDGTKTNFALEEVHYKRLMSIPDSPYLSFTVEEDLKIKYLLDIDQQSRLSLKDSMRNFGGSIVKQFVSCVMTGRPLNFSAVCWGYICAVQKLTRFAMAIPEFTDATLDQPLAKKILLLHNIDPMFNIRNAFFFQSDATSITAQLNRFGIFDMSLVDTLRSNLFSGILDSVRPMTWKQYFVTPWADSLEQEEKFEMLVSSLHNLRLDSETTCILSAVALFSTQTISEESIKVPLENIRRHQFNFSLLLYRYLVESIGKNEAVIAYPGFLATLDKLREMSDILRNKTIKIGPSPNVEEHLNSFIS